MIRSGERNLDERGAEAHDAFNCATAPCVGVQGQPQTPEKPRRATDFPEGAPRGCLVCGIDEAGRGPLAGPVTAGCVILGDDFPLDLLDDSKALSEWKRERAFALIAGNALAWSAGWASHEEIDRLDILRATLLAMRRAYLALPGLPGIVYVDGTAAPDLSRGHSLHPGTAPRVSPRVIPVIGGDAFVPAIMAASIVAKVARDRAMRRFDELYPDYGYAVHKGYPTKEHRRRCASLGASPIQRRTFHCGE